MERGIRLAAVTSSVAVVTATLCQVFAQQHPNSTLIGFLLAGVVFVAATRQAPDLAPEPTSEVERGSMPLIERPVLRAVYAAAAAVLLVLAWDGFSEHSFMLRAVAFWSLGGLCFALAAWQREGSGGDPSVRERDRSGRPLGMSSHHAALLLVVAAAVFFRFHQLGLTPIDMTSDHAEKLLDVRDVLAGERPVFFPRNTGRECLQFYLTALLVRVTPLELGHMVLKVGTALVGVLAVPFTYLLGRELYGRRVGLVAAALLAVSHWHVAIARVGLRFPFTAAFATPTLYFLIRAFRYGRRRDWMLCGGFLGIGLHGYTPMRIVPLLLVLLCLTKLALDWLDRRNGRIVPTDSLSPGFWVNAAIGGVTAVVFSLPLLRYMIDEPRRFWFRVVSRSADNDLGLMETIDTLLVNIENAAWMFNFKGDVVPVNTISWSPVLGWVMGGAFVLGSAWLYWAMIARRDRRAVYLFIMLLSLLLPSILSLSYPVENPSVVRAGGAPPVALIIAAVALVAWTTLLERVGRLSRAPIGRWLAPAGLAIMLAISVVYNYHWYFHRYHLQYVRFVGNPRDLAAALRDWVDSGGTLEHARHVTHEHWVDTRLVAIHLGDIDWNGAVRDWNLLPYDVNDGEARIYLLHQRDLSSLERLEQAFPHGRSRLVTASVPGGAKDFVVFEVPAQEQ
jgi:hypothetical protein